MKTHKLVVEVEVFEMVGGEQADPSKMDEATLVDELMAKISDVRVARGVKVASVRAVNYDGKWDD